MKWILMPKTGSNLGRHWDLSAGPVILGRSLACDIVIDDPCVSRRHCRLYPQGEQIHLEDLGSSHLALVNGDAVREAVVEAGDTISLGMTSFVVTQGVPQMETSSLAGSSEDTKSLFDNRVRIDVEEHATTLLEGQPKWNAELIQLFKLGRRLSQATVPTQLIKQCTVQVGEVLSPNHAGIAIRSRKDASVRWYPDLNGSDPLFVTTYEKAMKDQKALLVAVTEGGADSRGLSFVMAAPLCVGGEAIGAILVRSDVKQRVYDDTDLNRLLTIAQVAAPYFHTLSHIAALEDEVAVLDEHVGQACPLLGKSRAMAGVRALIRDVSRTALNILIVGETGTGKELAAQMIHDGSERALEPMVSVNCAALPDHLFESEMFGHEKGAFTSADKKRRGRFQLADKGTLFLDEIGELSSENQARLLRVLESGHFHAVGAEEESFADVRIVAATNRDLQRAVRDGRFRRDLYHRVCAVEIELPALRQRPSDIPLLAQHFVNEFTARAKHTRPSLTEEAMGYLQELTWSGNVRELRNAIERVTALAKDASITSRDFRFLDSSHDFDGDNGGANGKNLAALAEVERHHIVHILEQCNYNVSKAARVLGIHRNTLHNKIAEYGIGG